MLPRQRFGKQVRKLILSLNILDSDSALLNQVTDKMKINLNVFHARVMNWTVDEVSGAKVITQ